MAKDDGGPGMVEHGLGRAPRRVGEVHYHPQSVHLLHHGLTNTRENHVSQEGRKEGAKWSHSCKQIRIGKVLHAAVGQDNRRENTGKGCIVNVYSIATLNEMACESKWV